VGAVDDFVVLPGEFGGVVLDVSAGGEVAAESHGNGAGGDLGEAGDDDDVGGGDSGETGGEGEWDGEAVGEADDDIAHGLGGLEVGLFVRVAISLREVACDVVGDLMHGGSVVQIVDLVGLTDRVAELTGAA
jgi:hypothetical protein